MVMKIERERYEEAVPTLENFVGDIDRITESFHALQEPCPFSALFWNNAKQEIWNTEPEKRADLIKEMTFAVGQVLSCYRHEPKGHIDFKTNNVAGLFERFAKHLRVKIGSLTKEVKRGFICGPFTENETVPEFLTTAWEEAKCEIPDTPDPKMIPELPKEAGNVISFVSDDDGLLPMPIHILPPRIQKAIREIAETKSVPESMIAYLFLALGSACIGRARGVKYRKDWHEHANLYMLLIAESGAGKSHSFDYIFKYINDFEAKQKAAFKIARRQYEEDLIMFRKSKDAGKTPPKRPPNIQFLLDDSTLEAVSERLEDNPRGLFWTKDEFSSFFASLDKYNKGVNDGKNRLLQAWNVGPWSASRKTKDGDLQERFVPNGCIGIFGNVQPHLVNSIFSYDDVKQGLPQRFLYLRAIIEKPMILPTPDISDETDATIRCITEKLLSLELEVDGQGSTRTAYLTLTAEAKQMFENFSNVMQKQMFGKEAIGFSAKMAQMILRIALILHFLEWAQEPMQEGVNESYCDSEIGYATMCNAVKFANALWSHMQYARTHFPGTMTPKVSSELDDEKRTILKFIYKNEEFCKEWRGLSELIAAGLKWERGEKSLGKYLTKHKFKKTPKEAKTAKYKLFPVPDDFIQ